MFFHFKYLSVSRAVESEMFPCYSTVKLYVGEKHVVLTRLN